MLQQVRVSEVTRGKFALSNVENSALEPDGWPVSLHFAGLSTAAS